MTCLLLLKGLFLLESLVLEAQATPAMASPFLLTWMVRSHVARQRCCLTNARGVIAKRRMIKLAAGRADERGECYGRRKIAAGPGTGTELRAGHHVADEVFS